MKIEFTKNELAYISAIVGVLYVRLEKDAPKVARTLAKLRFKFTPNASAVSLGKKERDLLSYAFGYRVQMLGPEAATSAEYMLAAGIFRKVETP